MQEGGSLELGGRRYAIGSDGVLIGRDPDADLRVGSELSSRRHARVVWAQGELMLEDLGSRNGTKLNGEPVAGPRPLGPGDVIDVGGELITVHRDGAPATAPAPAPPARARHYEHSTVEEALDLSSTGLDWRSGPVTIGRDPSNDLVLKSPSVSREHAVIESAADGTPLIRDLGSRNGIRVNGRRVDRARIPAGATIGVGPFEVVLEGHRALSAVQTSSFQLLGRGVGVVAGDQTILQPTDIAIRPGELVVIVGESGAGKSTLLKALAGVQRPSAGEITVNGEPVGNVLSELGYLPQDEVVHPELTLREALDYAARLRLPPDTSPGEREAAVSSVLAELALEPHAETRIGNLSGGQRKRAGLAPELLNEPRLIFLDEPTTGLDPGLETRMMELFRELADAGRGVVVVTHATKNLALADRIVVLARGGILCYDADPAGITSFFEVPDFDGVYSAVEERGGEFWRSRSGFQLTPLPPETPAPPPAPRPRTGIVGQTAVLASRYSRLLYRDWRNLLLLLGAPPLLALLIAGLFPGNLFDPRRAGDVAAFIFMLTVVVIYVGAVASVREIVKEAPLFRRESAIGVHNLSYLASKVLVLGVLTTIQLAIIVAISFALQPIDGGASQIGRIAIVLLGTGIAANAAGLVISAVARSEDQATTFIPLAITPQMIFGGSIVPVAVMASPLDLFSGVIFARWSYAAAGTAVEMNDRIAADEAYARGERFGPDYFTLSAPEATAILGAFALAFLFTTWLLLGRSARRG